MVKCCILGRVWAKRGVGEQVWFVPNTDGRSGGSCDTKNILQILESIMKTVLSPLKLTRYCYLIITSVSLYLLQTYCAEINGTSEIPISQVFSDWENIGRATQAYIYKKQFFIFFKNFFFKKSNMCNIQKSQTLFYKWENIGSTA